MGTVVTRTSMPFETIEDFNTYLEQIQKKDDGDDVVLVSFDWLA